MENRKRYDILLIDPPWNHYGDPNKNAAAGKHYSLMTDGDVGSLPIRELLKRTFEFPLTELCEVRRWSPRAARAALAALASSARRNVARVGPWKRRATVFSIRPATTARGTFATRHGNLKPSWGRRRETHLLDAGHRTSDARR
jgi:hypothetical protein